MSEFKIEFFKPYELKIGFQSASVELERIRERRRAGLPARTLPPTQASINAKKALKCDLIASLLRKSGVSDKECVKTIKKVLEL